MRDKRGVSPAIASLVLIVVGVVAAAGVGVMTGVLVGDAEEKAKVPGHISIEGSTTVLPFATATAAAFMATPDGAMASMDVTGGGSTHGREMAHAGAIDIGMASSREKKRERVIQDGHPGATIYEVKVGGGMIAVIVNCDADATWNITNDTTDANGNISINYLKIWFETGNAPAALGTGHADWVTVQRSDPSGTEEVFAEWLGIDEGQDDQLPEAGVKLEAHGNVGVWTTVAAADKHIGFVDLGFVEAFEDVAKDQVAAKLITAADATPVTPDADYYADYTTASETLCALVMDGPDDKEALTRELYFYASSIPTGVSIGP